MRSTKDVLNQLSISMEDTVHSYGAGALKGTSFIDGTAFFPGGSGLWRGLSRNGSLPPEFPEITVFFMGHNFGKLSQLESCRRNGIEPMEGATWLVLRQYIKEAGLNPSECFFSNIYTGFQPSDKSSVGELVSEVKYKEECRRWAVEQLRIVKPKLVVVLGKPAEAEYVRCDHTRIEPDYIQMKHPMFYFSKGYRQNDSDTSRRVALEISTQVLKLKEKLKSL